MIMWKHLAQMHSDAGDDAIKCKGIIPYPREPLYIDILYIKLIPITSPTCW